jgi:hypothetical protein
VQSQYASRLVRVWQRAVYGGTEPAADEVRALCAGFSAAIDPPQRHAALHEQLA